MNSANLQASQSSHDQTSHERFRDQILDHVEVLKNLIYICGHGGCNDGQRAAYLILCEQELDDVIALVNFRSQIAGNEVVV